MDWGLIMALTREQLQQMLGRGAGAGMLGAGVGGMFGGNNNPANSANKYYDQIQDQASPYYQPYFQKGTEALNRGFDEYGNLMEHPGDKLNQIGQGYQQSPGFKFALDQALQGSGNAAAAGGMAGSPQHEQQNMGIASGMASQDYNNWMQNALELYGQGLSGNQETAGMGQQAGNSMADMIQSILSQKASTAYQGQQYKNENNPWGNILGGAGMLSAFL